MGGETAKEMNTPNHGLEELPTDCNGIPVPPLQFEQAIVHTAVQQLLLLQLQLE